MEPHTACCYRNHRRPPRDTRRCARRTERRLGLFKPLELSNTISALAKLGYVPSAAWMEAFAAAVGKHVSGTGARHGAHDAHTPRRPGVVCGEVSFSFPVAGLTGRFGGCNRSPCPWPRPPSQAADFNVLETTETLFGMASLGFRGERLALRQSSSAATSAMTDTSQIRQSCCAA
jgi:hypothetical protein